MKRCMKCILPETYPGITFNKKGVCNYCLSYTKMKYGGKRELINITNLYRNKNRKYDCIVALSGGRDSAFAAYYAKKVLNLRVLLCTVNNDFMPQQTKENILNIKDALDADIVVEKHDHVRKNVKHILSSWIHKPSPAMIGSLCTGCVTGYWSGLVKTAKRHQIPLVITGGDELEPSFATKLLSIFNNDKKLPLILGFLMEMIRNPLYILNRNCLIGFTKEYLSRFEYMKYYSSQYMKYYSRYLLYVPIFMFIEWNEEKILSVIQNDLNWKRPPHSTTTWRSDCKIHPLKQYLYKETLGFTKNDVLLSSMIREDMISRENALKRLETENIISQQLLIELFDELGLSFHDLDIALRRYKKTIGDRKSVGESDFK